jgi:hypothetical protein
MNAARPAMQPFKRIATSVGCVLLLGGALWSMPAWSQVVKCTDKNGKVEYLDIKELEKQGMDGRRCFAVNAPVNVISGPKGKGSGAASAPASAPAGGPMTAEQREELEQQLADETAELDKAKADLAEAESTRLGGERNYQRYQERLQPLKDAVAAHQKKVDQIRKQLASGS